MTAVAPTHGIDGVRRTATRLLGSSAKNSYDPALDIDWDAPVELDLKFMPYERLSLYGTPLWDRMSESQKVELSRQELASVASTGLWFEIILVHMLARWAYHQDPQDPRTQYALTEIGDETRHILMFAKAIDRLGAPTYRPRKILDQLARVYKALAKGPALFAPVLVAEEITDRLQREMVNDESVHPLVRMVNRIHVVEEARHVRFARAEVARQMARIGPAATVVANIVSAVVAALVATSMISPDVYAQVDSTRARRPRRHVPTRTSTRRGGGWPKRSWHFSTSRAWSPGTRGRSTAARICSDPQARRVTPDLEQPPSRAAASRTGGSAGRADDSGAG